METSALEVPYQSAIPSSGTPSQVAGKVWLYYFSAELLGTQSILMAISAWALSNHNTLAQNLVVVP